MSPQHSQQEMYFVIAVRSCAIAADLIVLGITWYSTYNTAREARRLHMKVPVTKLMLQDGTMYFVLLVVLNIAQVVCSLALKHIDLSSLVVAFWAIIVSRFLLNLRQVSETEGADDTLPSFVASDVRVVSTLVEQMGAPLSGSFGLSSLIYNVDDAELDKSLSLPEDPNDNEFILVFCRTARASSTGSTVCCEIVLYSIVSGSYVQILWTRLAIHSST
ncbi:hypothetical protein BKA93DRAFT_339722 [Sparassis latifolia]